MKTDTCKTIDIKPHQIWKQNWIDGSEFMKETIKGVCCNE